MKRLLATLAAGVVLAVAVSASPMPAAVVCKSVSATNATADCSRECMTTIVSQVLDSMVAHNPDTLPLATVYRATENSHPAALGMMTLWRTVTKTGDGTSTPNLLAIDTTNGQAYFALDITEGNEEVQYQSVLKGRIKVVDKQITELELFINRSRGDHGFSFSSEELAENYKRWMSPPANRTMATRAELLSLSEATFDPNSTFSVTVADDCQFTEEGWSVIDTGTDGNASSTPLACGWPADRPAATNARANLVIDEETGIVVVGGLVPGKVYPYANISAFIPNDMKTAQETQDVWYAEKKAKGDTVLLEPTASSGEVLEVLQYYNGELQGLQINVHLSGPDMQSVWTQ